MDPSPFRPNSTTPSPPQRATEAGGAEETRDTRLRRLALLFGLVMTAIIVGLLIRVGSPSAVLASWHSSKAQEHYEEGDLEGALASCEKALAALPDEPTLLKMRAQIRQERLEWPEALADLDKVLAHNPNYARGYLQRSFVHQQMQNHDAAIADARKARDWWASDEPEGHNALAYSLAVANRSLNEALAEAEKAIEVARKRQQHALAKQSPAAKQADESDSEATASHNDLGLSNYLDSRGYIYWRLGQQVRAQDAAQAKAKFQAALADFDEAIRLLNRWKQAAFDPAKKLVGRAIRERRLNDTLGVMHQHRFQAHDALGDQEKAGADREFAQRLGYDPAKHGL